MDGNRFDFEYHTVVIESKNKYFAKKCRNVIVPQLKRNKNYQKLLKKKGDNVS